MSKYSVQKILNEPALQDESVRASFELENQYLLEVNLNERIWAKLGSMIGYTGNVKFERQKIMEGGLGKTCKKAFTDAKPLMKVEGKGRAYFADNGKKVHVLNLQNEKLFVKGNNVLAFADTIKWDIKMMKRIAGIAVGGLFNWQFRGTGALAITTYFDPITLTVTPTSPVFTGLNAPIAWSNLLQPEIKTDISLKTFLGRGSGESFQIAFRGRGWVVLQPSEKVYYTRIPS